MSTNSNVEILRHLHSPYEWWPCDELQPDWALTSNLTDQDFLSMVHFPTSRSLPNQYPSIRRLSNVASGFGAFPRVATSSPLAAVSTISSHLIQPCQGVEDVSRLAKSHFACRDLPVEGNKPFCNEYSNLNILGKGRQAKSSPIGIKRKKITRSSVAQKFTHVISERQRRKGMNELFQKMQSILPQPIPKMDRSTVLTEMIKYIQILQKKLEELSRFKADIIASIEHNKRNLQDVSTDESPTSKKRLVHCESLHNLPGSTDMDCHKDPGVNVAVHIYEKDVFVTLTLLMKRPVLSQLILLFQQQSLEVVNAALSVNQDTAFYSIHAKAPNAFQLGSNDLQNMLLNFAMNQ